MLNKWVGIGRLTKDPEIKYLSSGGAVVNFSMATSEKWKDKNGEKQESTEYHNIVSFGKQAEIISEYLSKGSLVYIEGRLKTETYEKDGIKRYSTKIIVSDIKFLDTKKKASGDEPDPRERNKSDYGKPVEHPEDDLPF